MTSSEEVRLDKVGRQGKKETKLRRGKRKKKKKKKKEGRKVKERREGGQWMEVGMLVRGSVAS